MDNWYSNLRSAWRSLHGSKAGAKRDGVIGLDSDGKALRGRVTVPARFSYEENGKIGRIRRANRRRCRGFNLSH